MPADDAAQPVVLDPAAVAVLTLSLVVNALLFYNAFIRFPSSCSSGLRTRKLSARRSALRAEHQSGRLKEFAVSSAVQLNSYDYANWRALINNALRSRSPRAAVTVTGSAARERHHPEGRSRLPDRIGRDDGPSQRGRGGQVGWPLLLARRGAVADLLSYERRDAGRRRLLTMTIVRIDPSPINPNASRSTR